MNLTRSLRNLSDKDALERALAFATEAWSQKQDALVRAERYLRVYKALDPPIEEYATDNVGYEEEEAIHSNVYMPIGAAIALSGCTQIFNHFFSSPDYMEIEAADFWDDLFAKKVTAHLIKRHKEMCFKNKVFRTLLQAAIFDYAVTFPRWLIKPGYVPVRKEEVLHKSYGKIKVPYRRVRMEEEFRPDAVDRSDVVTIPYRQCAHDWRAIDGLNDSEGFYDWWEITVDEFVAGQKSDDRPFGKWKNVPEVLKAWKEHTVNQASEAEGDISNRKMKIERVWTEDHCIEWAYGHVIRRKNLPGWALQIWKIFEIPDKFEGMGFIQPLERLQYDINASVNSRRDFQNLVNNPFAVISKELLGAHEGPPQVLSGVTLVAPRRMPPKEGIYIHTPGAYTQQETFAEISNEINAMEKVSGVSENAMGAVTTGRTTAKEVSSVEMGMLARVVVTARRMEEECLEKIYMQQFLLEQQNLTKEEFFKHYGQFGQMMMSIRPEDYAWNALPRFHAKGTTELAGKDIRIQQFMTAMQQAMAMPALHDWQKIYSKLWQMLSPKDSHEFVKDPRVPEFNIPPNIENQMMARGQRVQVSPMNNHQEHIAEHKKLVNSLDFQLWPEIRKMQARQHIEEHERGGQQNRPIVPPMQDSSDPMRGMRGVA